MTNSSARGWLLVLACMVVAWAPCSRAAAADVKAQLAESTGQPAVIASIASVERLIGEFNYVMDSIDRHDVVEKVQALRTAVGNFKGIDLQRPIGAMMWFDGATAISIAFVPISNRDDFVATLQSYSFEIEHTDKNEYTIGVGGASLFAIIRDDYAYVADSNQTLQREFPNPVEATKKLHGEYDLAVTCQMAAVPDAMRAVFTTALFEETDETEKKVASDDAGQRLEQTLRDGVDAALRDADQVTLGWSLNRQERQARLDLVLTATRDSDLARQLNSLKSTRSEASRLIGPSAGFGATAAFELNSSFSDTLCELLDLAVLGSEEDEDEKEDQKDEKEQKLDKLKHEISENSFETDRIDMACSVEGKPGKFVLLLGWHSPSPEKLAKNFEELQSLNSEEMKKVDEYLGAAIYRQGLPDDTEDPLFGPDASWYYAVAESMTWLVVGGDNALPTLKTAIDRMGERSRVAAQRVPLDITLHAQKLQLFDNEVGSDTQKLFEQAFSQGDDRMQLELTGTEDGVRLRGSLGDGFIRAFGLLVVEELNNLLGVLKP